IHPSQPRVCLSIFREFLVGQAEKDREADLYACMIE
ncbi:hypothetical protein CSUI_007122, partial [Cystoisospora suis]